MVVELESAVPGEEGGKWQEPADVEDGGAQCGGGTRSTYLKAVVRDTAGDEVSVPARRCDVEMQVDPGPEEGTPRLGFSRVRSQGVSKSGSRHGSLMGLGNNYTEKGRRGGRGRRRKKKGTTA